MPKCLICLYAFTTCTGIFIFAFKQKQSTATLELNYILIPALSRTENGEWFEGTNGPVLRPTNKHTRAHSVRRHCRPMRIETLGLDSGLLPVVQSAPIVDCNPQIDNRDISRLLPAFHYCWRNYTARAYMQRCHALFGVLYVVRKNPVRPRTVVHYQGINCFVIFLWNSVQKKSVSYVIEALKLRVSMTFYPLLLTNMLDIPRWIPPCNAVQQIQFSWKSVQ